MQISITELLDPQGHHFCNGHRLAGDDPQTAIDARKQWITAGKQGAPPEVEPIDSFAGGTIEFRFKRTADKTGYEIATMFPKPPEAEAEHSRSNQ